MNISNLWQLVTFHHHLSRLLTGVVFALVTAQFSYADITLSHDEIPLAPNNHDQGFCTRIFRALGRRDPDSEKWNKSKEEWNQKYPWNAKSKPEEADLTAAQFQATAYLRVVMMPPDEDDEKAKRLAEYQRRYEHALQVIPLLYLSLDTSDKNYLELIGMELRSANPDLQKIIKSVSQLNMSLESDLKDSAEILNRLRSDWITSFNSNDKFTGNTIRAELPKDFINDIQELLDDELTAAEAFLVGHLYWKEFLTRDAARIVWTLREIGKEKNLVQTK